MLPIVWRPAGVSSDHGPREWMQTQRGLLRKQNADCAV
jgi:hypothetical protein